MIAPTNFTEELNLFLYVSGEVQKQFNIAKKAIYPDESYSLPDDWWSVWRCEHLLSDPSGEQHAVLFTNASTFLTFICHGFSDDFDALVCEFEAAFLGSLKAQGLILPEHVSTHTRLIRGNPRQLVGTMNQLADYAIDLACSPEDGPMPPAEVEKYLLNYCCMSLKEKFPYKAYYNKLRTHPPFGGEFDDGDGVVVPFPEVPEK